MPADDLSGKQIHDDAEIIPFSVDADIGKVTGPDKIRCFLSEILFQMIGTFTVFSTFSRMKGLFGGRFWKSHAAHQPVHSPDADVNAIITLKNVSNLVCSETFIIVRIDLKDDAFDVLVFFDSGSKVFAEVLIISASVDFQDTAESLDVVLKAELMDSVQSLSECGVKMAIAFFKMRFSSSS